MQTLELLNKATEYLQSKGIEGARNEAEILLCKALDCKRVDLYADFEKIVAEEEKAEMRDFLKRRISGEPLQYITGVVGFRFIELAVEEGVFIPRSETEILVQLALDHLNRNSAIGHRPSINPSPNLSPEGRGKLCGNCEEQSDVAIPSNENTDNGDCPQIDCHPEAKPKDLCNEDKCPHILEIGTGTGAIAISLAKEAGCMVTATDINMKALKAASLNAEKANVIDKISFTESHFFDELPPEKYDLIVSNPPYVAEKFKETLPVDVKREPTEALYSGEEGLNAVKEILSKAGNFLLEGAVVILEISPEQGESVMEFAKISGFTEINLEKDLADRDRFIKALWKQ